MMEFILSLKAKKTSSGARHEPTDGFEVQEEREERLSDRMLALKKCEKYEKEAISCFYNKEH